MKSPLPALIALMMMTGCAVQRPIATAPDTAIPGPEQQRALLAGLDAWEVRGRIAVRMDGEGAQANLHWRQDGESVRLRLSGPFGAGAWEIDWDPERLTVRSRDGEAALDYGGPGAAESFLADQLGWTFPVVSTRYWLRGLADPAAAAEEHFDDSGRLAVLDQHGWQVRYQDYALHGVLWLPRRFVMENPRGRVRVVIDRWAIDAPTGARDGTVAVPYNGAAPDSRRAGT